MNFGCCWASTSRSGLVSSGRSLLLSGATVVAVASGDRLSNHCQNGPAANGSICMTPRVSRAAEAGIGQQQRQHDERGVVAARQESRQLRRMSDERGPRLSPQMALKVPNRLSATTSGERPAVCGVERVDADRRFVERIEHDDVVSALLRDAGQQIGDEVLGFDDNDGPVGLKVLQDQVEQQRRLAYPVRPDDPGVAQRVGGVVADGAAWQPGALAICHDALARIAVRAGPDGSWMQRRLAGEVFVTIGDRPAGQPSDLGDGQALGGQ